MLDKPVYILGFAAHSQKEVDDARAPLTDEERALYTKLTRTWQDMAILGDEDVLDSLVEKGWAHYTRGWNDSGGLTWQYQRTHNFDDEE